MEGFIEVTEVGSGNDILINVSFICTVLQCNNKATIYMVNDNTYPWNVRESYEDILHKIKQAEVSWNREKKGLDITGPNGNTIFLPAEGYRWKMEIKNVKIDGDYWTRMPNSQTSARNLDFNSGSVCPLYCGNRFYGFSVRLCQETIKS